MKNRTAKSAIDIVMLLLCMLNAQAVAQQTDFEQRQTDVEFRWLSTVSGNDDRLGCGTNFVVDEEGNTYYGVTFMRGALWEDYTSVYPEFDRDPRVQTSFASGIVVVKIDTLGNRVWAKHYASNLAEHSKPPTLKIRDMQLRNGLLYFSMEISGQNEQHLYADPFIYMFDTTYNWPSPGSRLLPDSLRCFPFTIRSGAIVGLLITMDLDGNVIDRRCLTMVSKGYERHYSRRRDTITGSYVWDTVLSPYSINGFLSPTYIRDYHNRSHLFVRNLGTNHYLVVDEDTVYVGDQPWWRNGWQDSVCDVYHLVLDSNYNIISWKPMVCDIDRQCITDYPGMNRNPGYYPTLARVSIEGLAVDEEDNVYVTANFNSFTYDVWKYSRTGYSTYSDSTGTQSLPWPDPPNIEYPFRMMLDSTHYILVESLYAAEQVRALLKFDTAGNLLWVRQRYMESTDTVPFPWDFEYYLAPLLDSQYVYCKQNFAQGWEGIGKYHPAMIYNEDTLVPVSYFFDEDHQIRLETVPVDPPDTAFYQNYDIRPTYRMFSRFVYYVVYDKRTGDYVKVIFPGKGWMESEPYNYYIPQYSEPLATTPLRDGKIWSKQTPVVQAPLLSDRPHNPQRRIEVTDLEDNSTVAIDSTIYSWCPSLYLSDRGQVVASSYGLCYSCPPRPINYPSVAGDTPIYVSYYMPEYDRRRVPPCPGVDSVEAVSAIGSATLRWRGGEGQQVWQVAQMAADSTGAEPDSTAWERALLTETQEQSITVALDTCVWLRVRGMCGTGHYGPWSEAVEVCPKVGIGAEVMAGGVVLAPNPTNGLVAVTDALSGMPMNGVREVEVMSAMGTTVLSQRNSAYFDTRALAAGTYYVKAVTLRGTYLLKLVVEH